jgi:hypothetical protein
VQPHPAMPSETRINYKHELRKSLETFEGKPIWYKYFKDRSEQPLVLLGLDERFTVWTIINIEATSTGEDLITLKARSSLGILPEIKTNKIGESFRSRVHESLNAFRDEVTALRRSLSSIGHGTQQAKSFLPTLT